MLMMRNAQMSRACACNIREDTFRFRNSPVALFCHGIHCEIVLCVSQTRVVAENARPPPTEAVPAGRRFHEGYGDRTQKSSLVHASNRSGMPPTRVHCAPAVERMVRTREFGTFEECRCGQSDTSTRRSTHPPASVDGPSGHIGRNFAACAGQP